MNKQKQGAVMKTQIQHFDKLDRELAVGDCVAFNSFYKHGLAIGRIVALKKTRSTVAIIPLKEPHRRDAYWQEQYEEDITSRDMIKLDTKDVMFQVLKSK